MRARPRRTQMGDILGGGGFRSPEPLVPDFVPMEARPPPREERARALPERGPAASPRDTRHVLEGNFQGVAPPLPWAPANKALLQKNDDAGNARPAYQMPKWYPNEALPALPAEVVRVEQEAASARMAARLAAYERRAEAKEAYEAQQTETIERLAVEVRQAREGQRTFSQICEERLAGLESALERTKREDGAVREHISVLQKDFRDFAVNTVARQSAEIESQVSNGFARQNAATEEWRSSLRQRDSQLQAEVQRLSNAVDDASSELVRAQSELRTRITGLEASRLNGQAAAGLAPSLMGDAAPGGGMELLKHQMDSLRQGSDQVGARLSELWARCEGANASQQASQREAETRFASLSRAISTERDNLASRLAQRLEVLESRLGVERSETAAKQAELHDQVASGDHQGSIQLQDLASKLRMEMEGTERRLQGDILTLRSQIEADLAQLSSSRVAEEDARKASVATMLHRVEGTTDRHSELVTSLRQELDSCVKDVRDARETLRAESTARTDADRKMASDTSRATQTLATELGTLQRFVQKQAESVSGELEKMRWASTDRADRLSRYVDEKVAQVIGEPSSARGGGPDSAELDGRLATLKAGAGEQARLIEQRLEAFAEDLRTRLAHEEEQRARAIEAARQESDRSATSAEQRWAAAQADLKARFEAYVKHFDTSIASVQAAILKAAPSGVPEASPRLPPSLPALGPSPARSPGRHGLGPAFLSPAHGAAVPAQSTRPRLPADWQNDELRAVVDQRVHEEPDLASQVRGRLSRGETVTVKDVIERGGQRWASLGGRGGFVLASSERGTPLLEPVRARPVQQPPAASGAHQSSVKNNTSEEMQWAPTESDARSSSQASIITSDEPPQAPGEGTLPPARRPPATSGPSHIAGTPQEMQRAPSESEARSSSDARSLSRASMNTSDEPPRAPPEEGPSSEQTATLSSAEFVGSPASVSSTGALQLQLAEEVASDACRLGAEGVATQLQEHSDPQTDLSALGIRCPTSHHMETLHNDSEPYACDVCARDLPPPVDALYCETCDYVMCRSCAATLAASPGQLPDVIPVLDEGA